MREVETERKAEYARSERRIGITKEVWYLAQSQDDFDLWFKRCLAEATGVDLNNPPEMKPPELLSSYQA